MATSAIAFQGLLTPTNSNFNEATVSFNFKPPSNLEGKLCYVDTKAFGVSWSTSYPNMSGYFGFLLRSSWPQVQAASVEPLSSTNAGYSLMNASGNYPATTIGTAQSAAGTTINVTATTNIVEGMLVTGTNIPSGTTVQSVNTTTKNVVLTNATTAALAAGAAVQFAANVLNVSNAALIKPGMRIAGSGIPAGTTVSSVDGNAVTMSSWVNAAVSGNLTFIASSLDTIQRINSPLAVYFYGQASASVPTLISMPVGPHEVTFTISRFDQQPFTTASLALTTSILLSIVPADSRHNPIN